MAQNRIPAAVPLGASPAPTGAPLAPALRPLIQMAKTREQKRAEQRQKRAVKRKADEKRKLKEARRRTKKIHEMNEKRVKAIEQAAQKTKTKTKTGVSRITQDIHYPSPPSSPFNSLQQDIVEQIMVMHETSGKLPPHRTLLGQIGERECIMHMEEEGIEYMDANKFKTNCAGIDFVANQNRPFVQSKHHTGDNLVSAYGVDIDAREQHATAFADFLFSTQKGASAFRDAIAEKAEDWNHAGLKELVTFFPRDLVFDSDGEEVTDEEEKGLLNETGEGLADVLPLIVRGMVYPVQKDHFNKLPRHHRQFASKRKATHHDMHKASRSLGFVTEKERKAKRKLLDGDYKPGK